MMVLGGAGFGGSLRLGHPRDGISVLLRRDPESFLSPFFHHMGTEQKSGWLQPGRGPSQEPHCAGTPDLGLPVSRSVRNKSPLFTSHPVCGILS